MRRQVVPRAAEARLVAGDLCDPLATRVPVALPQRITDELLSALKPYHPPWVMTHFNHPKELAEPARFVLCRLADAGFPAMNQTVLGRFVEAGLLRTNEPVILHKKAIRVADALWAAEIEPRIPAEAICACEGPCSHFHRARARKAHSFQRLSGRRGFVELWAEFVRRLQH